MIRRHPHVFGEKKAHSADEAYQLWTEEKMKERKGTDVGLLDEVKKHYPGLLLAAKVQRKVARVGFDWDKTESVFDKMDEELTELKDACRQKDHAAMEEEVGDFLFSVVNLSRRMKIDAETALHTTVEKFRRRFRALEERVVAENKSLTAMSLDEMDAIWNDIKRHEKGA